jgi:hypothetical protein
MGRARNLYAGTEAAGCSSADILEISSKQKWSEENSMSPDSSFSAGV